jgi:hypothetical protein
LAVIGIAMIVHGRRHVRIRRMVGMLDCGRQSGRSTVWQRHG